MELGEECVATILFGVGSCPLVWRRIAAVALSVAQALMSKRGRDNGFVGDTLTAL